jgi:hypothetical protein
LVSATVSGLLYRLSSSILKLIHHVPFIHTGPYILCKRVAVDISVNVQVSLLKRTAG